MHFVELIEKLPLEPLAAEPGMLLLEACFDRRLELVEGFQPQRFRKRIVDGDRARRFARFHRHVELRSVAGTLRTRVLGRKRHLDQPRFAGAHADELILETRDEGAGTDINADIAAAAAFERRTVDLADEVDDDPIALFDLRPLGLGGEWPALLGAPAKPFVALRVGDLRDLALN